ncbi:very long-chain specific acyl-CoA dehydrogenase, mitochondrial-like [Sabethes cyaneus]|uniref:very long-chain specific acyl-CoA dehydrogenase, mitochondrial-like n=1 Tax=Sabethes cyaneus TaxID=53552 RepID=UPI00237DA64A|nr:very long-chain specific acyl-CoA dehydrogenase, mitochondrial-like [Sabethes cyaneus]
MLRQSTQVIIRYGNSLRVTPSIRFLSAVAQPVQQPEADIQNTSFVTNIFRGNVVPTHVFPYPEPAEEQKEMIHDLMNPIYRFLRFEHNPAVAEENGRADQETLDAMWKMGIFGMTAPEEYGGLGANSTTYVTFADAIGAIDLGLGAYIGAHQCIGWKGILLHGTEQQKHKYLPRATNGKTLAAFALTEPGAGSDISSVKTRAVKSSCGMYYTLNGSKLWISGGNEAGIFTVIAQTEVLHPETGEKQDALTAFIVERAFEGVSTGEPEKKMGIAASGTAAIYFDDVRVPIENVLGGEGNGFKVAVTTLNNGRFAIGGSMSGMMRTCIQKAAQHANKRIQFGRKIKEFGNVQEKLARMAMLQYVSQSMTYVIVGNIDAGVCDNQLEMAISKIFSTEAAFFVCDEAIQILGGNGYMKEMRLEKFLRDVRVFRIFEGANDVMRMFITLKGIKFAGEQLKELQQAVENPTANLSLILKAGSRRVARSLGIQNGIDLSEYVVNPLQESARKFSESVNIFAKSVESNLILHGKGIVQQQFTLKRLADCIIDIYAMACVLSRASRAIERKLPTAEHEFLMAVAWCTEANERVCFNIKQISKGHFLEHCNILTQIAKNVCDGEGVVQPLPLELLRDNPIVGTT